MKKYSLTLILVLCLFVITGGTYAAWSYYENAITATTIGTKGATISAIETTSAKGTIESSNDSIVLSFEPASATDHTVTLEGSGTMDLTFKPATGASATGLGKCTVTVTIDANETYGGKTVLKTASAGNTFTVDFSNGTTATINGSDVAGCLELAETFDLKTSKDHEKWDSEVTTISISLSIAENA